ncbi:OOP [Symbiodinium necroappetens]|uniref:OOP protein n=1 Tax=Symbiodinium necroappetens TaxID=1628268 RepID=A0A812KZW9_9DINO|nr:OOP [Symbiodinium necroappetens]
MADLTSRKKSSVLRGASAAFFFWLLGPARLFASGPPSTRGHQVLPERGERCLRRAFADVLESKGMEDLVTHRSMKSRRQQKAVRTWRKEGANWSTEPFVLSNGEEIIANLKHGTNILMNGAKEFPPWKDIRPEHAHRGHEWMEKTAINDIWQHHCVVPYVSDDWRYVLDPLERVLDKVDRAFSAVKHVRDVLDSSVKFKKAYRYAAQARWTIERRLRRCDRFSRAFLELLSSDDNATEAQRRAAAFLMILFEQDGVNLQHNGIYRDDPDAFLELQKVRGAVFNISLIWDQNIERDMETRAYLIRDRQDLDGIPPWILEDAVQSARQVGYPKANRDRGPWLLSLHDAVAEPVMRAAKSRALRELIHENRLRVAYLGGTGKNDNTPMLELLLQARQRLAKVVGYRTHADLVFTRTMASPNQAYGLLAKLRKEALPKARKELDELQLFARSQGADYELDHFDVEYWGQRFLEQRYGLRDEYVREFFPLPAVLRGLFWLLEELFHVKVIEESSDLTWAEHVRFFRIRDSDTEDLVASFFLDAHRRWGQKRRGFWSSSIQGYSEILGHRSTPRRPAVNVICDLEPPVGDTPSLLTHREVVKLFRVFGSSLRDLFCKQSEALLSGSKGLETDIVELPAYFLERWAYDRRVLSEMGRHYKSGDPLPQAAVDALSDSRTFLAGVRTLRKAARAHIDLELHSDYDPYGDINVFDLAKLIEGEYAVIRPRVQDRELCSWPLNTELAGAFYGELWAEALAADVFSVFDGAPASEPLGSSGERFRRLLLEPGGGKAPGTALQEFLKRPPSFATFLKDAKLLKDDLEEMKEPLQPEDEGENFDDSYYGEYGGVDEDFDDSYAEFEDAEDMYLSTSNEDQVGGSASSPG